MKRQGNARLRQKQGGRKKESVDITCAKSYAGNLHTSIGIAGNLCCVSIEGARRPLAHEARVSYHCAEK